MVVLAAERVAHRTEQLAAQVHVVLRLRELHLAGGERAAARVAARGQRGLVGAADEHVLVVAQIGLRGERAESVDRNAHGRLLFGCGSSCFR